MKIDKLKIGTFNVNSLSVRQSHVLEILETHKPDVFFLQELKCEEKNIYINNKLCGPFFLIQVLID